MMQPKPLTKFFVVRQRLPETSAPRYLSAQDAWTHDHAEARIYRSRTGAQSSIQQRMLNADVIEVSLTRSLFRWSEKEAARDGAA